MESIAYLLIHFKVSIVNWIKNDRLKFCGIDIPVITQNAFICAYIDDHSFRPMA